MNGHFSRWMTLGVLAAAPLFGSTELGCSSQVPPNSNGGASGSASAQCRSDADCPVILLCKLCPDGSCADPNVHCVSGACSAPNYTCKDKPATACASTESCPAGQHCTTEDGVCNRPPGCGPDAMCPAVCYGLCSSEKAPPKPCEGEGCPAPDCSAPESSVVSFIKSNKACKTAADCQIRYVGCGVTEDACTGAVYVNRSTDEAAFTKLASAYAECKTGSTSCAQCKRMPRPAACTNGMCQATTTP